MSAELLAVHDGGTIAGRFREDHRGRRTFVYDESWQAFEGAIALSVCMPVSLLEHDGAKVDAWLWGLLPDNELVLERWAQTFQVSARNPFRLLSHVGIDCPGAFQLVSEEQYLRLSTEPHGSIAWLDEREIGERLADVRRDPSRTRRASDAGQFSLGGAQPKIALYREGDRWGVPSGRRPTTHILKPPTGALEGFAENEHFCLRLAAALGLPVARSELRQFSGESCIVVERFDRASTAAMASAAAARAAELAASVAESALAADPERAASGAADAAARAADAAARAEALGKLAESRPVLRLHQEDMCQALAVHPARKYQSDGGPTPAAIADLLRSSSNRSRDDLLAFVDTLAFNWVIAGTDGHAKNYGLLHAARGRVRLAPLYDLATALPYRSMHPRKLKLAMSIGGEYRIDAIEGRHFRALGSALHVDPDHVIERARSLARQTADVVSSVGRELREAGLEHPILASLSIAIAARAAACAARL